MKKTKRLFGIKIHCAQCLTFLFKYEKEGPGSLVKCFTSNISEDTTKGDGACPSCGTQFARDGKIGNRPILKIIQGRVNVKGNTGKK